MEQPSTECPAEPSVSEAKTVTGDMDLDAEITLRTVADTILRITQCEPTEAEQAVKEIFALKGVSGKKLIFLRHDLFQIFGILDRKLRSEDRL